MEPTLIPENILDPNILAGMFILVWRDLCIRPRLSEYNKKTRSTRLRRHIPAIESHVGKSPEWNVHCAFDYRLSDWKQDKKATSIYQLTYHAEIPDVEKVLHIYVLGGSPWATKLRISTTLKDRKDQDYYLKTAVGDLGRASIIGEFESMKAIQKVTPKFIAPPIAQGPMKGKPDCHFYLGQYLPIIDELVEPTHFCEQIAMLHRNSVSPNRKYGFHTVTFNGDLPQKNDYPDSCESFFAAGFRHMLDMNKARAGPSEELDALLPAFFEKVIPRLPRPLEANIRPSLVHGDLWYGNAGVNTLEDKAVIFDPGCFYAHNEYELGNWRAKRNKFSKAYFDAYHAYIPKASPQEDYQDCIVLYSLRFNLHAASLFPTVLGHRESRNYTRYEVFGREIPEGLSSGFEA